MYDFCNEATVCCQGDGVESTFKLSRPGVLKGKNISDGIPITSDRSPRPALTRVLGYFVFVLIKNRKKKVTV